MGTVSGCFFPQLPWVFASAPLGVNNLPFQLAKNPLNKLLTTYGNTLTPLRISNVQALGDGFFNPLSMPPT